MKMAETTLEIQTEGRVVDKPGVCHIIKEVIGFVLYMHQQIHHTLQQLEVEFASLKLEQQRMVAASAERETQFKPSSQRKMIGQSRELKRGIKKLEKLMTSISNLLSAVQTMVHEIPEVQVVLLALGASSTRPQHLYEICFSDKGLVPKGVENCAPRKIARADVLSKKIIRELVSNGAGCAGSYLGPTKMFLLFKAPASISPSQDFLPKRDYTYSKKVQPFRVTITSCHENGENERSIQFYKEDTLMDTDPQNVNPHLDDMIWFQCKHTVKGLANQGQQC